MSNTPQDLFDRVAELTELYLLDEITDEQLAELEALVRDNKQAAQAMRTILKQAGTMRVVFSEQQRFASRVGEVDRNEYLALLQTLGPTQEPEPVHLVGSLDRKRPLWQHWPIVIPSAIAAILALAVILIVTLNNNESSSPIADNNQNKPAESAQPIPRDQTTTPVATLTAQHNATWGRPASAGPEHPLTTGSKLHPNQRLTLTAGFAEITTNQGAVAIIQAPAIIELLDNDNALRLHSGKLVGICETDSSKGFLVRTPHMDITDLGTRFGVVTSPQSTEAHVYQGEIAVSMPTATGPIRKTLSANQAVRSDAANGTLAVIPADINTFSQRLGVYQLPGTGVGLAMGEADPNWQVVAIDGKPLPTPTDLLISASASKQARVSNDPAIGQWLHIASDGERIEGKDWSVYTIQTQLNLPDNLLLERSSLYVRYFVDDAIDSIEINGKALPDKAQRINPTGKKQGVFEVAITETAMRHGENTVRFDVRNVNGTEAALHLTWQLVESPTP